MLRVGGYVQLTVLDVRQLASRWFAQERAKAEEGDYSLYLEPYMDALPECKGNHAGVQVGAALYAACLCRHSLLALMESADEVLIC